MRSDIGLTSRLEVRLRLVHEVDEVNLLGPVGDHKLAARVVGLARWLIAQLHARLQPRLERAGEWLAAGGVVPKDLSKFRGRNHTFSKWRRCAREDAGKLDPLRGFRFLCWIVHQ